ncbi:hypothetical protein TcBrA4_0074600 [Trypanosoma cruzi]|nr:hypothetical protein TcBrA4_0074600 [Trypanosoma cruzi]
MSSTHVVSVEGFFDETPSVCFTRSSYTIYSNCLSSLMLTFVLLLQLVEFFSYPSLLLSSNMYGERVLIDLAACKKAINVSIPFAKSTSFGIHTIADTGDLYKYLIDQQETNSLNRYTSISCNDFFYRDRKSSFTMDLLYILPH